MNKDAIIFACANPTPEIFPEDAKAGGAKVIATGRSDFPNQINNVLAFPGVFRGTFDVRASDINEEMKIAAAKALAGLISDEELNADYIIPKAFDPRVGKTVAAAVAAEKAVKTRKKGQMTPDKAKAAKKEAKTTAAEGTEKAEKKAPVKESAAKKPADEPIQVIIQSPIGGEITPEAILAKVGEADTVYVRVDENKAYWVRGEEHGSVDLW